MTIETFIKKWSNNYCDWDKRYGYQCVDLMRQYIKEVCGFNPYTVIPATNYAKNMFKNFKSNKYFTKVFNTPTGIPPKGAIMFWGTYPFVTGIAGHVAICNSADINNFVSFDQNYPTNSPCKLVRHSYKGVMGWLIPKK